MTGLSPRTARRRPQTVPAPGPRGATAALARGGETDVPPFPPALGLEGRLVTFAASLLVGAAAIHVGATAVGVAGARGYGHAVLTALFGALVWGLLDGIPLLGGLLALVAWVGVVRWRYSGGWLRSAVVGVAAWIAAVVVLAALELFGIGAVSALGVPGA